MKKKLFLYTTVIVAVISIGVLLYAALYGNPRMTASSKNGLPPLQMKVAIRGTIAQSSYLGEVGNILVVADDPAKYEFDKASVFLTKDTVFYRNGERVAYEAELLSPGMVVEVEITGTIRESYPVQVDARIVNILSE